MCAIKYRKSCELRGTWHGFEGNTEASTLEGARLEKKLVDDFQALENQEFDTFNSEVRTSPLHSEDIGLIKYSVS